MANTRYPSTLLTCEARLVWVSLFQPKKSAKARPGAEPQYQTDIIFNPAQMATPQFATLKAAANQVATEHFGAKLAGLIAADKFTNPFWKNERKIDVATGKMPDGYEPGGVYITVKSKDRPGVTANTAAGMVPIIDEREVYGGIWAIVSLDCYAYDNQQNGVNFGLRNVLKVRDDTKISGGGAASPEQDFAGVAAPPPATAGGTATAGALFGSASGLI